MERHYFCLTEIYSQGPGLTRICEEDLGAAVGPPWLEDSSRVRPSAADCSRALANLLIYMLKRVELKLHPCLTPQPCGRKCVFLLILTAHRWFVYMNFIMSYVFPPTPLSINLYSREPLRPPLDPSAAPPPNIHVDGCNEDVYDRCSCFLHVY